MPNPNGDVQIRELRRAVQQMFMGFASLIDEPAHRSSARDLVLNAVLELDLVVRGEQGEVVDDVNDAIVSALDEVMQFSLSFPGDD